MFTFPFLLSCVFCLYIQYISYICYYLLFCTGSPRLASPEEVNVTSAAQVPVVLSFQLIAFPVPSEYIWEKCDGYLCWVINDTSEYNISINGLVTDLTILEVQPPDFGLYRLSVNNGIGEPVTFERYLQAQGESLLKYMSFSGFCLRKHKLFVTGFYTSF